MTNPESNSGLYDRVYEIGNLYSAWVRVEESDGCAGIDGVTLERFAENPDAELARLGRELAEESYRPLPAAQFFVPKRGGGRRRLCVLAVRDRVAQHAAINVIRSRIEAEFEDVSYAYRRGRSVKQALDQVERLRDAGYQWVVDADISSYFENVDPGLLLGRVRELIEDERIVGLIEQWIAAFVYDGKEMTTISRGGRSSLNSSSGSTPSSNIRARASTPRGGGALTFRWGITRSCCEARRRRND